MFANNPSNIKIPLNWTKQGNPEAHICKERGPTLSEIYHEDEWIIAQNPSDHFLCWWRRELGQAYQVQNPSWQERWCLENQISSQPGRSERRWLLGQRKGTAHLWVVHLHICIFAYLFYLFTYLFACLCKSRGSRGSDCPRTHSFTKDNLYFLILPLCSCNF